MRETKTQIVRATILVSSLVMFSVPCLNNQVGTECLIRAGVLEMSWVLSSSRNHDLSGNLKLPVIFQFLC
jgi:hypothetical protein